ncbi:MAG: MFS transporter [Thermoplasmata archaeon]
MRSSKATVILTVIIIVTMTLAVRASNNMLMTTVPLVAKYDFAYSQQEIGLISALFAFSSFSVSFFINARLGTEKRRILFVLSAIGYAIILPLFYFTTSYLLWGMVFLGGFTLGAIMPNIVNSIRLFHDRKIRETILGIYTLSLSGSLILGPAIESLILNVYTLKYVFLFFMPFGIVTAVISPFIAFPKEERKLNKVKTFSNPGFKVAIYNLLTYNIPFAIIVTFAGIYARDVYQVSLSFVTLLFALFFVSSFFSRIFLTFFPPRYVWRYMTLAMSITMVGLVIIFMAPNIIIYSIALLLLGIPHGFTYPLSLLTLSRSYDSASINAANSYFMSILSAIGIFTPAIGGFLAQSIGLRLTFLSIVPVILILLVLTKVTYKKEIDEYV